MLYMILASLISASPILVDSANCDSTQCYILGENTFRDATTMVGKYGTLKSQNDTALKLISSYETTVRHMTARITLSDSKSKVQETLIKHHESQAYSNKWKYGVLGVAVGFALGALLTLVG